MTDDAELSDVFIQLQNIGQTIKEGFETAITGWADNCFPNDEIMIWFIKGEIKLITHKPLQFHKIAQFMSLFEYYGHIRAKKYMTCIIYTIWFE